jgi:3-methyladenine DNA glycosylase/8-oxoguanine DNA glycosylase
MATQVLQHLEKHDPIMHRYIINHEPIDFKSLRRPVFVAMVGAVIGRRVSFALARRRREALYKLLGTEFTHLDIEKHSNDQFKYCMGPQDVEVVRGLAQYYRQHPISTKEDIMKVSVSGFGKWCKINTILVSMIDDNVFLTGDKVIQRRIKELYGRNDAEFIRGKIEDWKPHLSFVTWYLWR